MAYIDVVAVKFSKEGKTYLFSAPSWTRAIHEGSQVKVETSKGEDYGEVIAKETFDEKSDDLQFVVKVAGATLPLKRVLGVVTYNEIYYPEAVSEAAE